MRLLPLVASGLLLVGCSHVHIGSDIPFVAETLLAAHSAAGLLPVCPEGATAGYETRPVNTWTRDPATKIHLTCDRTSMMGRMSINWY